MALTVDELDNLNRLQRKLEESAPRDELMLRYYLGQQRVEQLGMAIPPAMRRFLVVANWCRVQVDTIIDRQQVRSWTIPDSQDIDPVLSRIWDNSNLASQLNMFNKDRCIYGRAFMTAGSNEADPEMPLVRVESPREMVADVDIRREVVKSAARFYGVSEETGQSPTHAALYLPNHTSWLEARGDRWVEVDRDEHRLGRVPVVMHLNRRTSASWAGEPEISDMIPLVDAAARSLTNLQFAQEAHGVPRMWMTGVSRGDFVDADGKLVPQFEAYFDAIHALTSKDAKIGQLDASDLKNFETALQLYGRQASIVTGFPARYFGITSTNPPTEGAIRGDETQLVRSVERQNTEVGATLGWVGALAYRFATQKWVRGNQVKTDFFDPATPTVSQREDALAKRRAAGVLSREGYWDELGWSKERKDRERAYFAAEADDPLMQAFSDLMGGSNAASNLSA